MEKTAQKYPFPSKKVSRGIFNTHTEKKKTKPPKPIKTKKTQDSNNRKHTEKKPQTQKIKAKKPKQTTNKRSLGEKKSHVFGSKKFALRHLKQSL